MSELRRVSLRTVLDWSRTRHEMLPWGVCLSVTASLGRFLVERAQDLERRGAPYRPFYFSQDVILLDSNGDVRMSPVQRVSWRYLAPEQFRDISDASSDVFAAGVVLWEMLTAETLFKGDTPAEVEYSVTVGPIPRVSAVRGGIPNALDQFVASLLARDRAERLAAHTLFAECSVTAHQLGCKMSRESTAEVVRAVDRDTSAEPARELAPPAAGELTLTNEVRFRLAISMEEITLDLRPEEGFLLSRLQQESLNLQELTETCPMGSQELRDSVSRMLAAGILTITD